MAVKDCGQAASNELFFIYCTEDKIESDSEPEQLVIFAQDTSDPQNYNYFLLDESLSETNEQNFRLVNNL